MCKKHKSDAPGIQRYVTTRSAEFSHRSPHLSCWTMPPWHRAAVRLLMTLNGHFGSDPGL